MPRGPSWCATIEGLRFRRQARPTRKETRFGCQDQASRTRTRTGPHQQRNTRPLCRVGDRRQEPLFIHRGRPGRPRPPQGRARGSEARRSARRRQAGQEGRQEGRRCRGCDRSACRARSGCAYCSDYARRANCGCVCFASCTCSSCSCRSGCRCNGSTDGISCRDPCDSQPRNCPRFGDPDCVQPGHPGHPGCGAGTTCSVGQQNCLVDPSNRSRRAPTPNNARQTGRSRPVSATSCGTFLGTRSPR